MPCRQWVSTNASLAPPYLRARRRDEPYDRTDRETGRACRTGTAFLRCSPVTTGQSPFTLPPVREPCQQGAHSSLEKASLHSCPPRTSADRGGRSCPACLLESQEQSLVRSISCSSAALEPA